MSTLRHSVIGVFDVKHVERSCVYLAHVLEMKTETNYGILNLLIRVPTQ